MFAQEYCFDKTLDKLAGEMVRSYPDLQGLKRSSEIRAELVKEFRRLGVEDVPRSWMRDKRRRKIDYEEIGWQQLVQEFEQAQIKIPQAEYLLRIAKEQKLRFDEHHVVEKLMYFYLKKYLNQREEESRERLAELGKQFTYFVRAHGRDPKDLAEFVKLGDVRMCVDPQTGEEAPWVYVGAGPSEIRGSSRFRVVAYSPFNSGSRSRFRWIVYRGGRVTEWRSETILSAHKRMIESNTKLAQKEEEAQARELAENQEQIVQAQQAMTAALVGSFRPEPEVKPKKKALRITIRELW